MNIDLELYRIFYAVAKNGNITKASRELLISQPAVSKAIKNLETQLGGTLFVRTKRGVVLTEEGKELLIYVRQIMELADNAERQFTNLVSLETGHIRIGASQTLTREFLLPYLEEFHQRYPKIRIQIETNIADVNVKKLRNGNLDLVILNLPRELGNDIKVYQCATIHDCFIVNKDYLELTNKKLKLEELNNYPLIMPSKTANTRKFIEEYYLVNRVLLKPSMELASYTLIVEFAKMGLGIGYATREYVQKDLDKQLLYALEVEPKMATRHIGLAISSHHVASFSAKKLIEIILTRTQNK